MNAPVKPTDPPLAEPGKRPTGKRPTGGDDRATPPRSGQRGGATGAADAAPQRDDDEDEWRHEPVAPVDEPNPLRSLGKAVGETVTGSDPDTSSRKR